MNKWRLTLDKVIAVPVLFLFVWYWASTLLYVTPNNPVRIRFLGAMTHFEKFFYQKWSFFAPPPKYNDSLYYTFVPKDKKGEELKFEVLSPIWKQKQANAPFNEQENILDYILFGSVDQLARVIRDKDMYKGVFLSEGIDEKGGISDEKVFDPRANFPALATLKNYALLICRANKIDPSLYDAKITVTIRFVPAYKNRGDPNPVSIEVVNYRVGQFEIPKAL